MDVAFRMRFQVFQQARCVCRGGIQIVVKRRVVQQQSYCSDNILALAAVTTGLSSCVNNWLDQTPSNGTPTSSAITNYNDARTAMYGMYDGLQGNSTYTQYYAARMFYYGDVRGDDMQARTQGMRTSSCLRKSFRQLC